MSRPSVGRDAAPDHPQPVPDVPGPWGRLVRLFSSITLGVWLLATLFVYSSIGSAGIFYPTSWRFWDGGVWVHEQLRQWRAFEMTEFEWFHWWPFDLLMALICINVAVATWRRIPFHRLNYGVWTIHVGILVMTLGSVWYFSTKIEGDAPVLRRQVAVTLPTGETGTLPVMPGNGIIVDGTDGPWRFDVQSADPHWSMLTGPAKGEKVYSVNVAVRAPPGGDTPASGQVFIRQLLTGYPELTEDLIRSDDPAQPMARAVKVLGRKLIDEDLKLELQHAPQTHLYLANWVSKSWAIYVREVLPGGRRTPWAQRPADGIPLYNDYIGSRDEVWTRDDTLPLDPLDVSVPPVEAGDPLPDDALRVSAYLRYASLSASRVADDTRLDPWAEVLVRSPGGDQRYELTAFDPRNRTAAEGVMALSWAADEAQFEDLCERRDPVLVLAVPDDGVELERTLDLAEMMSGGQEFTPLDGSDYEYRIDFWQDDWEIQPGRVVSMAQVSLRSPEREFKRWVFSDPRMPQVDRAVAEEHDHASHAGQPHPEDEDPAHGGMGAELPLDERLVLTYRPGKTPAPITIIAGPAERALHLLLTSAAGALDPQPLEVGEEVLLGEEVTLEVTRFLARSRAETRPEIVPLEQRVRDAREQRSMVKVEVPGSRGGRSVWVPFHQYAFEDPNFTMRRYGFRPTTVELEDGRVVELILSRQRLPLPAPVVLDDFHVSSHVGGFTGRTTSILNWTSEIRFHEDGGELTDPLSVSVNDPREHAGLWYFQAQWDPPDPPRFSGDAGSQGLNFTVLGVGSRHGVGIQLLGSILATLGMLYAFYVKPLLRRRLRVRHGAAGVAEAARSRPRPLVPAVSPLSGDPS